MSPDDYEEVCNKCTTIIHMAATTNFNENLRKSVQLNVHGVRHFIFMICELFVHLCI